MKALEFFQNDNGEFSMNRLVLCGAFISSTLILFFLTGAKMMTEGYLTIYLAAFVTSYAASRAGDYKMAQTKERADNGMDSGKSQDN